MKNILLVEENTDIAVAVKIMLENAGYKVTVASGAGECKQFVRQNSYHLILLDLMAPEMYGYDLYEDLCKKSKSLFVFHSHVPLGPGIVRLFKKMGVKDHIVKPFNKTDLLIRLNDILNDAN